MLLNHTWNKQIHPSIHPHLSSRTLFFLFFFLPQHAILTAWYNNNNNNKVILGETAYNWICLSWLVLGIVLQHSLLGNIKKDCETLYLSIYHLSIQPSIDLYGCLSFLLFLKPSVHFFLTATFPLSRSTSSPGAQLLKSYSWKQIWTSLNLADMICLEKYVSSFLHFNLVFYAWMPYPRCSQMTFVPTGP